MENQTPKTLISADKLNLMLAICAILISSASFYATYLQADAAKKQVKAATWPWLSFSSGNYNSKENRAEIVLNIKNAGAGPALIKKFSYHYQGKTWTDPYALLTACCISKEELSKQEKTLDFNKHSLLTSGVSNAILGAGDEIDAIRFVKGSAEETLFWDKLNGARWEIVMSACYCSLLEECYVTKQGQQVQEVDSCAAY